MTATDEEELAVLPAVFEHACNVYKTMEAEAELHGGVDEPAHLIWEGHLTKLFARLHLSVPYYTAVTRELKRMGCIAQKRRGGGNAMSQWYILTAPTEELFRQEARIPSLTKRKADRLAALEQRVRDRDKVIDKIQSDYNLIIEILQEKEAHNV